VRAVAGGGGDHGEKKGAKKDRHEPEGCSDHTEGTVLVWPCGCCAHADCALSVPSGDAGLETKRMSRALMECEAHGEVLVPLQGAGARVGRSAMGAYKLVGEAEGPFKALGTSVLETVAAVAEAAVEMDGVMDLFVSGARMAPEGLDAAGVRAELGPFVGLVTSLTSREVSYVELVGEAAKLIDGFHFARCQQDVGDGYVCGASFMHRGGCGARADGEFDRCWFCKSEDLLGEELTQGASQRASQVDCGWDEGAFQCANPACRRWLLREKQADQCNMTGCLCMMSQLEAAAMSNTMDTSMVREGFMHSQPYGTCARCYGFTGDQCFYPLKTQSHWEGNLFQLGARVTLPASYVYDEEGGVRGHVLAPEALPPRMLPWAEAHASFPGYCGCGELRVLVRSAVGAQGESFEAARERLGSLWLRNPVDLVANGAEVDWEPPEGDAPRASLTMMVDALKDRSVVDRAVDLVDDVLDCARGGLDRCEEVAAVDGDYEAFVQELNDLGEGLRTMARPAMSRLRGVASQAVFADYMEEFEVEIEWRYRRLRYSALTYSLGHALQPFLMCFPEMDARVAGCMAASGVALSSAEVRWEDVEMVRGTLRACSRLTRAVGLSEAVVVKGCALELTDLARHVMVEDVDVKESALVATFVTMREQDVEMIPLLLNSSSDVRGYWPLVDVVHAMSKLASGLLGLARVSPNLAAWREMMLVAVVANLVPREYPGTPYAMRMHRAWGAGAVADLGATVLATCQQVEKRWGLDYPAASPGELMDSEVPLPWFMESMGVEEAHAVLADCEMLASTLQMAWTKAPDPRPAFWDLLVMTRKALRQARSRVPKPEIKAEPAVRGEDPEVTSAFTLGGAGYGEEGGRASDGRNVRQRLS